MSTLAEINREHASRILLQLSQQRASGTHCDVCVCVGEHRFLAHKCVLSANSDKLSNLVVEASGEDGLSNDIEIEIQGISAAGFEILLNYFYCGVLCLEPYTVTHAWMTAAYLGLTDVVDKCNEYCQQSITSISVQSPNNSQKIVRRGQMKAISHNPNFRLNKKQLRTESEELKNSSQKSDKSNESWSTDPSSQNSVASNNTVQSTTAQYVHIMSSNPVSEEWDSPIQQSTPQRNNVWQQENRDQPSNVKREIANHQAIVNNAEPVTIPENVSSPMSYTTLSVVSQQTQDNQSQEGLQQQNAYTNSPAQQPRNNATMEMQTTVPTATHNSVMVGDIFQPDNSTPTMHTDSSGPDGQDQIILQVQQLRFQQQHLQQLHNIKKVDDSIDDQQMLPNPVSCKRKRKAPTKISKSEDMEASSDCNKQLVVRKTRSLIAHTAAVPHVTPEVMDQLYEKYPEVIRQEPTVGSNDVSLLLQRGKARQRKSSEQNALNNTVRSILDATNIVESSDPRVPDAVLLIMDRFTALRDNINDNYIRKQLTLKIKHSIHCKKWRVKRQSLKSTETLKDEVKQSTKERRQSWLNDPKNTNTTVNCEPISTTTRQDIINIPETH